MGKHAYLIIAHNEFEVLGALLRMIDDERNDIYLHIDQKVGDISALELEKNVNKSKLYIVDNRISVTWGDYSQIQCEYILLKEATKQKYDYYHLLSGVDLPIKTQDSIHKFFDECGKKEFVHIDAPVLEDEYIRRVDKYWMIKGRHRTTFQKIVNRSLLLLQTPLHRTKRNNLKYQKGANWFSITDGLARYAVENEKIIRKYFKYTVTADEMFLQTLLNSSEFVNHLYDKSMSGNYDSIKREIDWERGDPYVYRIGDLNNLLNSSNFFARKFSWNVDKEIVKALEKNIVGE